MCDCRCDSSPQLPQEATVEQQIKALRRHIATGLVSGSDKRWIPSHREDEFLKHVTDLTKRLKRARGVYANNAQAPEQGRPRFKKLGVSKGILDTYSQVMSSSAAEWFFSLSNNMIAAWNSSGDWPQKVVARGILAHNTRTNAKRPSDDPFKMPNLYHEEVWKLAETQSLMSRAGGSHVVAETSISKDIQDVVDSRFEKLVILHAVSTSVMRSTKAHDILYDESQNVKQGRGPDQKKRKSKDVVSLDQADSKSVSVPSKR